MNNGKYILPQVMRFISRHDFNSCVNRYDGFHHKRKLTPWDQFLALTFGHLSYCHSLREIVTCLESQEESLYHLGFRTSVARSTLAYANEHRDWRIYRDLALLLTREAQILYNNEPLDLLDDDTQYYAVDSITIELCLSLFPWAKVKTIRARIKLNLQMDLRGDLPHFFTIVNARKHDVHFLDEMTFVSGAYYIFDRGYGDFVRFHALHKIGAFFVIRAKSDFGFRRLYSHAKDTGVGIRCDQVVVLSHDLSRKKYPEKLRRIKYYDQETERTFVYLTNDFDCDALMIVRLYKYRWKIELFFKWIKQHLQIQSFWGYSENAVKTQICVALCGYLLVAIAKKRLSIERPLYEILQILHVTLLTKDELSSLFCAAEIQSDLDCEEKQLKLEGF